jgi:Protein of unknown function (DUF3047)
MRSSAPCLSLLCVLAAGCASVPDDSLVWSEAVVRALERERGEVVEVARFSRLRPGTPVAPWEPWLIVRGNPPTKYRATEVDGVVALEAEGVEGGSGMTRTIRIDPQAQPVLEWRWRVPLPEAGRPPLTVTSRASPMARLSLAFHGDPDKLDFEDRVKLRMAKALTINGLPYASLLYVWMVNQPVDTVLHSPHTDRVRMIVAESGVERAGQWITLRRNVVEDFRRAFGEEPGDIVAVGLMTDPGDDGSPRRTLYGDITFRSAP